MSDLQLILKIINAVKKHECLWNVNANDYAKRDKLEKAWESVAHEVGKSEIFCREKWRNVRTGFLRSIQHQIRSSHEDNANQECQAVKRKSFYLHDQMAFFLPAAEALEEARKKRKLSKSLKSTVMENDTDGDNSLMTAYNLVAKYEEVDDESKSDHETDVEHHTLLINGDVYTVNEDVNRDDCNIDEIIKRIENKKSVTIRGNKHQEKNPIYNKDKSNEDLNTDSESSSNNKSNQSIVKGNNSNNDLLKCKENPESTTKKLCETSSNQPLQFSEREEQQLLQFFRSCTDDILTLSKRKQRLFKKRVLDLIDELHDS